MNSRTRTCLLFFSLLILNAQSQTISWARTFGSNNNDVAGETALDFSGNVISVGSFLGIGYFGNDSLFTYLNTADGYVVKFDSAGNQLWVTQVHGLDYENVQDVACDSLNNIYIIGTTMYGIMVFAGDTIPSRETYLAKLDSNGIPLWAKMIFGRNPYSLTFRPYNLLVQSNNEIYIAKSFNYQSYCGTDTIETLGVEDIVITKFDSAGNVIWYHTIGSPYTDSFYGITADNAGNIYCNFYIQSPAEYDGQPFMTGAGNTIAKWSPDGVLLNTRQIQNDFYGLINYLASENRIILVANYYHALQIDSFSFPAVTPFPNRHFAVFKLDTSLTAVSAADFGSDALVTAIGCFGNKIRLSGFTDTILTIGADILNSPAQEYTIFLTTLDSSLSPEWARYFVGSNYNNHPVSIVSHEEGEFYMGIFCGTPLDYYGTIYTAGNTFQNPYLFKFSDIIPTSISYGPERTPILEAHIYPNPCSGTFNIVLKEISTGRTTLLIRNLIGEILQQIILTDKVTALNLEQPDGLYFVTVSTDKEIYTAKIVVQR